MGAIVDELYASFMEQGVKASIYVVCGRNEKLKEELASKDWNKVVEESKKPKKRRLLSRIFRRGSKAVDDTTNSVSTPGDVKVVGLGFVTKMAEYMVAADILVSKAGPGKHSSDAFGLAKVLQVTVTSHFCYFLFAGYQEPLPKLLA